MKRRQFLTSAIATGLLPALGRTADVSGKHVLLRSSWQSENIGDIAHTPGMLALLEKHRPNDRVTLWPGDLPAEVENLLKARFPELVVARTKADQEAALKACDFFLHGSGPGLVGRKEAQLARAAGTPYGFGGVTLSDDELKNNRDLLADAKFVFARDKHSLQALQKADVKGPKTAFGPDATFALDLRDDTAAEKLLQDHELEPGKFLCAEPRLRWTPYWEIRPRPRKTTGRHHSMGEGDQDEGVCGAGNDLRGATLEAPAVRPAAGRCEAERSRAGPLLADS